MSKKGHEAEIRYNLIRRKKASRIPITTTIDQALKKAGIPL